MGFTFTKTEFPGLFIIEPQVYGDSRGYFLETYNKTSFLEAGLDMEFVQDNESKSSKGVLRGLHFQHEHTQGKLVCAKEGEIYDMVVDLRYGSPTYKKWMGIHLSAENKKMFYVPKGFAHGFIVLSQTAVFSYKCTDTYYPQSEGGIMYNDPDIGVKLPIDIAPILSPKDQELKPLSETDVNFIYDRSDIF